jgi:hypothetical protein
VGLALYGPVGSHEGNSGESRSPKPGSHAGRDRPEPRWSRRPRAGRGRSTHRTNLRRFDVHEEASVKTGARRWRDFPDIPSASSASTERHERIFGSSHSLSRRHAAPRRTSAWDLGPGLAEDADGDTLHAEIETDLEQGCLLKSMDLGTAATESQVTRLTGASFRVSTPKLPGAKDQTCPHSAILVPDDGSFAVWAAEMGDAIRCSEPGALPRHGDR